MTKHELFDYAKRIGKTLTSYWNDDMYICPSCDDIFEWSNDNYNEETQKYECPSCGEVVAESELETASIFDYLIDRVLEYRFIIDSNLNYKGVLAYITLGGPTAWIDTTYNSIFVTWGTEKACYPLDGDICDEINEYYNTYYNSMK